MPIMLKLTVLPRQQIAIGMSSGCRFNDFTPACRHVSYSAAPAAQLCTASAAASPLTAAFSKVEPRQKSPQNAIRLLASCATGVPRGVSTNADPHLRRTDTGERIAADLCSLRESTCLLVHTRCKCSSAKPDALSIQNEHFSEAQSLLCSSTYSGQPSSACRTGVCAHLWVTAHSGSLKFLPLSQGSTLSIALTSCGRMTSRYS